MNQTFTEAQQFSEHLREIEACSDARDWAKGKTAQQAWDECERADWLLWWVTRDVPKNRTGIVLVACQIARLALPYVPEGEGRPLAAIEAAEQWAKDPSPKNPGSFHLPLEKVRKARKAAEDVAADDADAAAYAAAAAAAAVAAAAAAAADDADAAAYAAAAAVAAAADNADAATGKRIITQSLSIIRAAFACPWRPA